MTCCDSGAGGGPPRPVATQFFYNLILFLRKFTFTPVDDLNPDLDPGGRRREAWRRGYTSRRHGSRRQASWPSPAWQLCGCLRGQKKHSTPWTMASSSAPQITASTSVIQNVPALCLPLTLLLPAPYSPTPPPPCSPRCFSLLPARQASRCRSRRACPGPTRCSLNRTRGCSSRRAAQPAPGLVAGRGGGQRLLHRPRSRGRAEPRLLHRRPPPRLLHRRLW